MNDLRCHFSGQRKQPRKVLKETILAKQNNRCFYCGTRFDVLTLPTYDHLLPFSYSYNNEDQNFVAACSKCNSLKSGKVFDSLTEALIYVRQKRKAKKLPVFNVFGDIQTKKIVAEVLLTEVPKRLLLADPRDCSDEQLDQQIAACRLMKKHVNEYIELSSRRRPARTT